MTPLDAGRHFQGNQDLSEQFHASSLNLPMRPRILVALAEIEGADQALFRGMALARVLRADLHVLRVLNERKLAGSRLARHRSVNALGFVQQSHEAHRKTRQWLRDSAADEISTDRLTLMNGELVACATEYMRFSRASLIVMPALRGSFGAMVTRLVRQADAPVLVARQPGERDNIVAATDLRNPGYPVLRKASELGAALDATVIAVHNVVPVSLTVCHQMVWHLGVLYNEEAQASAARLEVASRQIDVHTRSVVTEQVDPAWGILRQATACDADLVVVGTRARSWFDRFMTGSVAADVVTRAKRSVLVTPVHDGDQVFAG
jgi:nucleotide-binding universal stress UspA family protein